MMTPKMGTAGLINATTRSLLSSSFLREKKKEKKKAFNPVDKSSCLRMLFPLFSPKNDRLFDCFVGRARVESAEKSQAAAAAAGRRRRREHRCGGGTAVAGLFSPCLETP